MLFPRIFWSEISRPFLRYSTAILLSYICGFFNIRWASNPPLSNIIHSFPVIIIYSLFQNAIILFVPGLKILLIILNNKSIAFGTIITTSHVYLAANDRGIIASKPPLISRLIVKSRQTKPGTNRVPITMDLPLAIMATSPPMESRVIARHRCWYSNNPYPHSKYRPDVSLSVAIPP